MWLIFHYHLPIFHQNRLLRSHYVYMDFFFKNKPRQSPLKQHLWLRCVIKLKRWHWTLQTPMVALLISNADTWTLQPMILTLQTLHGTFFFLKYKQKYLHLLSGWGPKKDEMKWKRLTWEWRWVMLANVWQRTQLISERPSKTDQQEIDRIVDSSVCIRRWGSDSEENLTDSIVFVKYNRYIDPCQLWDSAL